MSEGKNEDKIRRVVRFLLKVALIGIVLIGVMFAYMDVKYNNKSRMGELLVGKSIKINAEYGEEVNVTIQSADDVEIVSISAMGLNVFKVFLNVSTNVGQYEQIPLKVKTSFFGNEITNCSYLHDDQLSESIDFEYKQEPSYTIGDLMQFLNVYDSYEISKVDISSKKRDNSAFEYCVVWRYKNDTNVHVNWIRAEYDANKSEWNLTEATVKEDTFYLSIQGVQFEPNSKLTANYVVEVNFLMAEIED